MLLITVLIVPAARWSMFLAAKLALLQPLMLLGFVVLAAIPKFPLTQLGIGAVWMLAVRWVLLDQRRRFPGCLRLLTNPVRIGSASPTFLEWYGDESLFAAGGQWLRLDGSWR